ncbi:hypothetical protein EDD11_007684 [Mortierella claussenii]|nr:hypothetical protein EDD11_007684 [Mortierella claussenii]
MPVRRIRAFVGAVLLLATAALSVAAEPVHNPAAQIRISSGGHKILDRQQQQQQPPLDQWQDRSSSSAEHPSRHRGRNSFQWNHVNMPSTTTKVHESCVKTETSNWPLREEHYVAGSSLPWEKGHDPIDSFAGHFPIRTWQQEGLHGDTSAFYWYFPAIKPKVENPPLIIWLQGGPGSSSLIGLFFENGPIRVNENMKLERKPDTWADEYSILYIDQPVGTGYSFVTRLQDNDTEVTGDPDVLEQISILIEDELQRDQTRQQQLFERFDHAHSSSFIGDEEDTVAGRQRRITFKSATSWRDKIKKHASLYSFGYVKDLRGVASDLILFLDQFYRRYPEVQKADLYLAGESYAGKMIPALAHEIMTSNNNRSHNHESDSGAEVETHQSIYFPLKGIALGNSLTDPISQVQVHADHAYFLGLISRTQADKMRLLQDRAAMEALNGRFLESNQYRQQIFELFKNCTGSLNWYDVRKGQVPNDWSRMETFMNLDHIKDALNVFGPRSWFLKEHGVCESEIQRIQDGRVKTRYFKDPLVLKTMHGDIMTSSAWMVSDLLQRGIKVLAYQGIFDFRDGPAGSTHWIEQLDWSGRETFLKAERELWMQNCTLAGYVTKVPGLTRAIVLGAGHLTPMDQGAHSLAMIRSLVEDTALAKETEAHCNGRTFDEHVI